MSTASDEIALYGNAISALAYAGFAAYLMARESLPATDRRSARTFAAALWASAAWAALGLLGPLRPAPALAWATAAADLLRYGLWFGFLLSLFDVGPTGHAERGLRRLRAIAALSLALAAALLLLRAFAGFGSGGARIEIAAALALPVCGLLLVEQLFRNLGEGSRWNAKPVCLALCCVFVYDIYLYAEGMLFGGFDVDALSVRAAVHALAVPFLFVAVRRGTDWIVRLQISRAAAFYSATLILAGAYLLFMSAVGYYVRYFGGNWGRALQLGLLVFGIACLAMLMFSGSLRSWLRVFVGKHFYRYRYDYREEWLRFTGMLAAKRSPQEMGELIVRGLAKMVECPAGSLWTRNGGDAEYSQAARWNMAPIAATEPADSSLCAFLRGEGWVVDLDEFRASPRQYGALVLPTWLLAAPNGWLVVPLLAGEDLLGFVLLARPLTAIKLNWEVLDLLKTAARQAAGYLAQMQATEALLEARKFEAFNRMSAFVVHDLKNIVAQLSLMLKNAQRLHDNPEFQQDMLLTVESSLEKMRRLMLQLREGAPPAGGSRGVELEPIFGRLSAMARSQGRDLETEASERLATRGHEERLERVLGHLVQNALDATPPSGRVWIRAARRGGQLQVEIGDTGCGMTEEFVRSKLFKPFHTTKHSGMGIGTYESLQYVRELGGALEVASDAGRGTVVQVQLPLFDAQRGPDLLHQGAA